MRTNIAHIMIAYRAHCDKLIAQAGGKPDDKIDNLQILPANILKGYFSALQKGKYGGN